MKCVFYVLKFLSNFKFHVGFYMIEQMVECLNKGQRKAAISSTQTRILPFVTSLWTIQLYQILLSAVHLSNLSFTRKNNYSIYAMIMTIIIKESGSFTKTSRSFMLKIPYISSHVLPHEESMSTYFRETFLPNYTISFYMRPNAFLARPYPTYA